MAVGSLRRSARDRQRVRLWRGGACVVCVHTVAGGKDSACPLSGSISSKYSVSSSDTISGMKGAGQRLMTSQFHLSVRKNACCFTDSEPSWPKRASLKVTHQQDSSVIRQQHGCYNYNSTPPLPFPSPPLTPPLPLPPFPHPSTNSFAMMSLACLLIGTSEG